MCLPTRTVISESSPPPPCFLHKPFHHRHASARANHRATLHSFSKPQARRELLPPGLFALALSPLPAPRPMLRHHPARHPVRHPVLMFLSTPPLQRGKRHGSAAFQGASRARGASGSAPACGLRQSPGAIILLVIILPCCSCQENANARPVRAFSVPRFCGLAAWRRILLGQDHSEGEHRRPRVGSPDQLHSCGLGAGSGAETL
jgi:hypothetical protein